VSEKGENKNKRNCSTSNRPDGGRNEGESRNERACKQLEKHKATRQPRALRKQPDKKQCGMR